MTTGSDTAPALERLNRRDWGLIAFAILVSAVSLGIVWRYFHLAFPEASIHFRVTRAQSEPLAQRFLEARGFDLRGEIHAARFDYDNQAKVFLERELGLARSQALIHREVRLWRWENRWFRPLTKEEFDVSVTPGGQIVGFEHEIKDDAPGASLSEAAARTLAEQFLAGPMHLQLNALAFVSSRQHTRTHRIDYVFTWKDRAPLAAHTEGLSSAAVHYLTEASYRRQVTIEGDQIGGYEEYLKVPDDWTRAYERLRSQNNTAGGIDTALLIVLALAMLVVLTQRIRRSDVRWRIAVWVGGAGAVLSFLAALNQLPGNLFDYDTTQSWSAFLTRGITNAILSGIGVGVLLALLTAAAEPLYRERFQGQLSLSSYLSWRGLRSKPFFTSVVLGIMLAFFFFAYQTVFYLIANHFGAWAPADIPYDSLLNTRFPWIFVLLGGFFPAISEEFAFRMLAIPLFEKWFRWLWVAIIAAAFLWGFGHAAYPNEPWWIRGLEVGLGGVLLSWIMVRYGILTTVVWHYTVDALYTAMLLLRSHNTYLQWSGGTTALIAALPLLAAVVAYARFGGFATHDELDNAAAGTAPPLPAPERPAIAVPDYRPVSLRMWTWGLVVAAVLLSAFAVRVPQWRSYLRFRTTPDQAEATARSFLKQQGIQLKGYHAVVQASTPVNLEGEETTEAQYEIFHQFGRVALMKRFSAQVPAAYWRVRFFKPLEEEEFAVDVRPGGRRVFAFSHIFSDSAPGASPTLAQAQQIAEAFAARQGQPVTGMILRTAQLEKRQARMDADFIWEAPKGSPLNAGSTVYRVEVQTAGRNIAVFRSFFHIPEARYRQLHESTFATVLLLIARVVMYAGVIGLVLFLFFVFARKADVPWRWVLTLSVVVAAVSLLDTANRLPELIARYPTEQPWSAWIVVMVIGVVVTAIGAFLVTALLLAPLEVVAPHVWAIRQKLARRRWAADALGAAVVGTLWTVGWERAIEVIGTRLHGFMEAPVPSAPTALTNLIPGLSALLRAGVSAIWLAAILGIVLPSLLWAWRNQRRLAVVVGLVLLWAGSLSSPHSTGQFLLEGLLTAITLALVLSFAAFFLRDNPLAWFSAALVPLLTRPALGFLGLGVARYTLMGILLLAITAAFLLWLGRLATRPEPEPES